MQAGKPARIARSAAGGAGTLLKAPHSIGFEVKEGETMHSFSLLFNMKLGPQYPRRGPAGAVAVLSAELGPLPAPPRNTTACDDYCSTHHYKVRTILRIPAVSSLSTANCC